MDYFKILNLSKEPFSNSPNPEFFYNSRQHLDCLQKLELSLLLRRGLNVVIGDVGTGKTTLCRQLIRKFATDQNVETHLILDPHFHNSTEFLITVARMFTGHKLSLGSNDWQIKEQIKQYLFSRGVDQDQKTVLIIDEGQKIPGFCLEILREFLNYETNEYKLLQIVIFAQREFEETIRKYANFADRINLYHLLQPLNFRDTCLMVQFRLDQSVGDLPQKPQLFTYPALMAIYRASGGYPRKIINLCHQCILAMIIQNRSKIGYFQVRTCGRRVFAQEPHRWKWVTATAILTGCIAVTLLAAPDQLKGLFPWKTKGLSTASLQKTEPQPVPPNIREAPPVFETQMAVTEPPPAVMEPMLPDPEPEKESEGESLPSVEDQVEAPAHTPQSHPSFSPVLGQVTLKQSETLSRVIRSVYGQFNSKYFKSLLKLNSDIINPNRVKIGQIISLPAIPAEVTPPASNAWCVLIQETATLETAFDYLRTYPKEAPPVRLIPYWHPHQGHKFALVLKAFYEDEASARKQLDALPAELSSDGKVSVLWDENTVFFADPFDLEQ
ncbi:MAG: AAA family ATPase [Desulfobacterales bacterium]|nr:MAG: AAA family ATPase [Desulfobacterales bacterium]